jgi:hypothetical protein
MCRTRPFSSKISRSAVEIIKEIPLDQLALTNGYFVRASGRKMAITGNPQCDFTTITFDPLPIFTTLL